MVEVVGEAQNGFEAIRQVQVLNPDVILMDLEMPIMDGYEATRRIKVNPLAPRIIILSVHSSLEDQQRAREAGADYFVVKGTGYEILLNAILAIPGSFSSTNPQQRNS